MDTFLSKIQYKGYRTGEYTGIQERTVEEIDQLIQDFPWVKEGHMTEVGMEGPSITIERKDGSFLKLAHYYNGKLAAYLLTDQNKLLKQTADRIEDGIAIVNSFCTDTLDEGKFKTNPTSHAQAHFATGEHIYTMKKGSLLASLLSFSILPALSSSILIFALTKAPLHSLDRPLIIAFSFMALVWGFISVLCILVWRLYFQHVSYSQDVFIDITKGTDEFTFGTSYDNRVYRQKDIASIELYKNSASKCFWQDLSVTKVTFANGEQIKISGLVLECYFPGAVNARYQSISKYLPQIK